MEAFVAGVGLRGPGLPGWAASVPILAGREPWLDADILVPPPSLLPPNERRRAGLPVRLALAVAEEAVAMAGLAPHSVRGVFASGNGEGAVLHDLLCALAAPEPAVSPTQFHNSVHNAVAGYWAMGAGSREPVTCLGAHDDTWAAALLKALAEVRVERAPVLCCVYDTPMPEPLRGKRPTAAAFAVALVLVPEKRPGVVVRLTGEWRPEAAASRTECGTGIRIDNPLAVVLPLLRAIATGRSGRAEFGLLDGALAVRVAP